MTSAGAKARNFIRGPNRWERARSLTEIRFNRLLYDDKPAGADVTTLDEFVAAEGRFSRSLSDLLQPGGEAERAHDSITSHFLRATAGERLPFPARFNADSSLARLCYALTLSIKTRLVVETGVGYGISSALILGALETIGCGRLISIDLPTLADPHGRFVGKAVPERLTPYWTLYRGSSRRWLPEILHSVDQLELFISDSANVYTLQAWEIDEAWPRLTNPGAAVFNNVSRRFWKRLKRLDGARAYAIRQLDKTECVTAVVLKGFRS